MQIECRWVDAFATGEQSEYGLGRAGRSEHMTRGTFGAGYRQLSKICNRRLDRLELNLVTDGRGGGMTIDMANLLELHPSIGQSIPHAYSSTMSILARCCDVIGIAWKSVNKH